MGKKKKYLTKSVNLGTALNPARILAEKYIKKNGSQEFSSLIRKLLVTFLSNQKEFEGWKRDALIFERKELSKQIQNISKKLQKNADELEKRGVDLDNL